MLSVTNTDLTPSPHCIVFSWWSFRLLFNTASLRLLHSTSKCSNIGRCKSSSFPDVFVISLCGCLSLCVLASMRRKQTCRGATHQVVTSDGTTSAPRGRACGRGVTGWPCAAPQRAHVPGLADIVLRAWPQGIEHCHLHAVC